jgi:hypothetical protein
MLQEPFAVTGQVDIQLQASEATPCVVLHANGIDIQSVELLVYEGEHDMHKQHPGATKGEGHLLASLQLSALRQLHSMASIVHCSGCELCNYQRPLLLQC